MNTIETTKTKQLSIPVGFQYSSPASGKEWVVTGIRPGGVCEIHQVGRFVSGQIYTRDIRIAVDAGTAVPMETTEAARKILRRCNFR